MSDLIDRDALLEQIDIDSDGNEGQYGDEWFFIKTIENAPTIDAVEVVKCKDCKHWHDHITTTWCSRGAELRPQESGWVKRDADDFCSYGERREP